MNETGKVLIVDDQIINIRLLQRKLEKNGLTIISATSGPDALTLLESESPDVILLDIMMPGMDGIEVCRRLKEIDHLRDVPVIFITARTSKEGKLEGLGVGAADYLTKPIDLDETLARVQTQIRIIQQHRANLSLTRALEEARRQQGIMHMTEGIAHNLNNLLGVAVGYLSLIKNAAKENDKIQRNSNQLETSLKRMSRIVHQLTIVGQFDVSEMKTMPLDPIIQAAIDRFHRVASEDIPVEEVIDLPEDFKLLTNADLLEGTLERLLMNGWESYGENEVPEKKSLTLHARIDGANTLIIEVVDQGRGIPDEIRDHVFDPFVSTFSSIGRGMGLTLARHAVLSLHGSLELIDNQPRGIRSTIKLPYKAEVAPLPAQASA